MRFIRLLIISAACAAAAFAASNISSTLTATLSSGAFTGASLTFSGNASMSNIGSGTMTATVSFSSTSGANLLAPYTFTLSGGLGTLTGNLTLPSSVLAAGPISGASASVNGGTGSVSTDVGTFPSLTGKVTGSTSAGLTMTLSGAGTITVGGTPAPNITAVLDAGSYSPTIAQGGIFVVKGTNMSGSGLNEESFPLPQKSNGVSIAFTSTTGTATNAYLIYEYNESGVNQLAAVLPSTLAAGAYKVTVTNGASTSPAFSVTVVQRKPEFLSQDGSGNGLVLLQNYVSAAQLDVNRFTTETINGVTISPAHPGQTLIAWATGMGAAPGGDNEPSPGYNFLTNGVNVQVLVGGTTITPFYAGRAPSLAGADQINFVLPANIPTSCAIPFQLSVNNVLTNPTFLSIAPAGSNACTYPGFTTAQLQSYDNGTIVTNASFSVEQISETTVEGNYQLDQAVGTISELTGFELPALATVVNLPTTQGCTVTQVTPSSQALVPTAVPIRLDAGAITLNGPSGSGASNLVLTETDKTYSGTLTGRPGGAYSLNAAGGVDAGAFSATVNVGPLLTITGGLPTTVNRGSGLTLSWTGGNSSDGVQVVGSAYTIASGNLQTGAFFSCYTTVGAGMINIPSSILNQLPSISAAAVANGTGQTLLAVYSETHPVSGNGLFSIPLVAGGSISNAVFTGLVDISAAPAYQ